MENTRSAFLKVASGLATFSGLLVFIGVFLTVINAVARKFFGVAFIWVDEVVQYAAVEACFLGTPYLLMKDKQLSVGILSSVIKSKLVLKIIRFVFLVVEVVIFVLMARYCVTAAAGLHKTGILLNSVDFPKYILYYILFGTFILDLIALISAPILNKGGFYDD